MPSVNAIAGTKSDMRKHRCFSVSC